MWMTVYITHAIEAAELLVEHLRKNGILSRMCRIGKENENPEYEVLVPQPEVNSAQNLIIDNELF